VAASAVAEVVLSTANAGKVDPSEAMATSKAERRRIVGIAIPFLNSLSMALRSTRRDAGSAVPTLNETKITFNSDCYEYLFREPHAIGSPELT
jgi:hypothetical protein